MAKPSGRLCSFLAQRLSAYVFKKRDLYAVKNALIAAGVSSADADAAARDIVKTVFGVDSFDETDYDRCFALSHLPGDLLRVAYRFHGVFRVFVGSDAVGVFLCEDCTAYDDPAEGRPLPQLSDRLLHGGDRGGHQRA